MKKHVGLFFTRGVSLGTWAQVGNLTRELAIYERLVERGYEVSFVTYGDKTDLDYSDGLGGVKLLCNEGGLDPEEYEKRLISVHGNKFEQFSVIKTNQMYGADIALHIAKKLSRPFIARCGYLWSVNAAKEHGEASERSIEADRIERLAFSNADAISVTTEAMKRNVIGRLPDCNNKIRVIPNYVDTGAFRSIECGKIPNQIIFVGRIAPEKNLVSLFEAIRGMDVRLVIIGDGPQKKELETKYADLGERIEWVGNLPNSELPAHINRSAIFVLPSLYEGHPKALIEAMSCETPVIGCDSPGVREIVSNMENGLLCGHASEQIRQALQLLLTDPELGKRLGSNARRFIVDNYALDKITEMEIQMLGHLGC